MGKLDEIKAKEGTLEQLQNIIFIEKGVIKEKINFVLKFLDNSIFHSEDDILKMSKKEQFDIYVNSIIQILVQLNNGEEINACKCSYYPLRSLIESALNGDLGLKFKLLTTKSKEGRSEIHLDVVYNLAHRITYNLL